MQSPPGVSQQDSARRSDAPEVHAEMRHPPTGQGQTPVRNTTNHDSNPEKIAPANPGSTPPRLTTQSSRRPKTQSAPPRAPKKASATIANTFEYEGSCTPEPPLARRSSDCLFKI